MGGPTSKMSPSLINSAVNCETKPVSRRFLRTWWNLIISAILTKMVINLRTVLEYAQQADTLRTRVVGMFEHIPRSYYSCDE
jgi:hypothetical protein